MSSLFDSLEISDKKYNYTLVQCKKNRQAINMISTAFNRILSPNIDSVATFNFSIPYYITDSVTQKMIKNPEYDSIMTENLILLKVGDTMNPIFQSYYIIKNLTESLDSLSIQVETNSREQVLDKNIITIGGAGIERELINNVDNNGVMNLIEQQTTWKVGYVAPSCLIDSLETGDVTKFRWISALSKPILQFLHDDVATSYNLIIIYDTYNKLINLYDKNNYGTHTNIILSEENYLKDLAKSTKGVDVCTRLEVSGSSGSNPISIDTLTLDGTNYVTNYDYYKKSGQMSAPLILALDYFDELLTVKDVEFKILKKQLDDINASVVIKTSELGLITEAQKALDGIQASYASNSDALNLPDATKNCSDNVTAVANKTGEIALLNAQIITIGVQITQISVDINKKTACIVNTKTLIFNDDLIEELEDWTLTETWSSDVYTTPELLKKASEDVLAIYNIPVLEYTCSLVDFFILKEAQHIWAKIKLGDFVRIYSPKLKTNVDLRIVSYSYNIDTNALSIIFSNKDKKVDDVKNIGSSITQAVSSAKYLNAKKVEWNQIQGTKNSVDTFLNSNFDVALQQIQALSARNKISITENGIMISDAGNPDDLLYLTAGQIIVSDDNLKSAKVAINSSGISAEVITGRLLIAENLYIENEAGNLSFTKDGFELKDDKYKLLLSAKGVVNSDNLTQVDNVDSLHPMLINFNIDENVNVVSEVLLKLSVEPYRAYESSVLVADGGTTVSTGGTMTTSSAGSHKTKMFAYNSDVTSGGDTPYVTYLRYMAKSSVGVDIPFVFKTTSDSPLVDIYAQEDTISHTHTFDAQSYSTGARTLNGSLVYGVYEAPITLGTMEITVDGVVRATAIASQQIVDLTSYISVKGWHTISISSPAKNRFSVALSIKSYIGA